MNAHASVCTSSECYQHVYWVGVEVWLWVWVSISMSMRGGFGYLFMLSSSGASVGRLSFPDLIHSRLFCHCFAVH